MLKIMGPLVAAMALASCQSFNSRFVDMNADAIPNGLQYALPTALMTVELQQNGGKLWLGVSRPFLVGDPKATYTLSASAGLLSDQRYKVRVDPQTRLLDYINSVSEGQATQILSNLASAAGASKGAANYNENSLDDLGGDAVAAVQVYSKVFDPMGEANCDFARTCKLTELADELNRKAREFLRCKDGAESRYYDRCKEFGEVNTTFEITLEPVFKMEARPSAARARSAPSVCASSICYRAPAPYLMHVYVKGSRDVSEIVMLPNKGPILSLDLPSGVFAAARARVELIYGMPARVEVDQGNELVGITAIPLTVINSFFEAVSSVFKLQVTYNSEYENALDQRLSRQAKQDEYNARQKERAAAAGGGAGGGSTSSSGGGEQDEGVVPENSLEFLSDDTEVVDAAARMSLTVVSEPDKLLFAVPLQAEDPPASEDKEDKTATHGVLDDTDSEGGHDLGTAPH